MNQLAMKYKKYLTMRVNKKDKADDLGIIISQCETLAEEIEEERVEVDKHLD